MRKVPSIFKSAIRASNSKFQRNSRAQDSPSIRLDLFKVEKHLTNSSSKINSPERTKMSTRTEGIPFKFPQIFNVCFQPKN